MHRTEPYDKERYVIRSAWLVRAVYVFGAIAWLFALYGFLRLFKLDVRYLWFFGPLVAFFTAYNFLLFYINFFYQPFDVKKHRRFVSAFWKETKRQPTVDVFLPICGESTAILHETFLAVSRMEYEKKKVYVLDDRGSEEHKLLAKELGFTYLSREDKGYMKKAGNLKHGFDRSSGEFIAVFDADFAPRPEFLTELVPYLQDPELAIVQSPQYFETTGPVHKRSALEYGAGYVQEDFYRIIQTSRDHFGAAICVGSNAVYRRSALADIGGPYLIEHSEDVYTGFALLRKGWKLKYVPLILAIGLCPDNMHAFFHQQHRWCSGSMELMTDRNFWTAKLPVGTKLCFISGFLYYISHIVFVLMSFQIFALLFWQFDSIRLAYVIPFLPSLAFSFVVLPLFRTRFPRYGSFLARAANAQSYIHAMFTKATKGSLSWVATGTVKASTSRAYSQAALFASLYLFLYVILVSVAIAIGHFPLFDLNYLSLVFWIVFFLVSCLMYLWHVYEVFDLEKREELKQRMISAFGLWWWRLRTAGLYLFLLVAMPTTAYAYGVAHPHVVPAPVAPVAESAPAPAAVAPAPKPVQAPEPAPTPAPVPTPAPMLSPTITVTAAFGDSLTTLSRKATLQFEADAGLTLPTWQLIYVESNLAVNQPFVRVFPGDTLTFARTDIQSLVNDLPNLPADQVERLQGIANGQ
jgi:cellulose synthase (UDP-forming)